MKNVTKMGHFVNTFYNVFNRRNSSYFIIKPLDFTISCRNDHFNESNRQKLIFFSFSIFTKTRLPGFGVTEYTIPASSTAAGGGDYLKFCFFKLMKYTKECLVICFPLANERKCFRKSIL